MLKIGQVMGKGFYVPYDSKRLLLKEGKKQKHCMKNFKDVLDEEMNKARGVKWD